MAMVGSDTSGGAATLLETTPSGRGAADASVAIGALCSRETLEPSVSSLVVAGVLTIGAGIPARRSWRIATLYVRPVAASNTAYTRDGCCETDVDVQPARSTAATANDFSLIIVGPFRKPLSFPTVKV